MRHGSLFSGIGGFDLAAEWAGWENVFHCEWNEFGQKILKYYWPNAISYGDITKTDFTIWRGRIDILTGGFPCQPYSLAGKRKGKEDDRHLWPEMLRAIREIRPGWIVGENVPGIINWSGGLVFEEVQVDMETEGYEVFPIVLPVVGRGGVHRRRRVWFVAYSASNAITGQNGESTETKGERIAVNEQVRGEQQQTVQFKGLDDLSWNITNTYDKGLEGWVSESGKDGCTIRKKRKSFDSVDIRQNAWINLPTQSPLCGRDDGIPSRLDGITFPKWRNESIKGYGNAIVPQIAFQIFKAIEDMSNE